MRNVQHDDPAEEADADLAHLAIVKAVVRRGQNRTVEDLRRFGKADAVLAAVLLVLRVIPLETPGHWHSLM